MLNKYNNTLLETTIKATINIPYHLREVTSNNKTVILLFEEIQPTIKVVLRQLINEYPSLASAIYDDNGELGKFLSLYLNDKNVKNLELLDTRLYQADNEIFIRPAIAGG